MKSNKKLIIGFSIVTAVLVIAVVSLTAVLAAFTTQATGGFSISYAAINVKATVSAEHKVQGGTAAQVGTATFDGTEQETDNSHIKTLNEEPTPIILQKGKDYYIVFSVTNNDADNAITVAGTVTGYSENKNVLAYSAVGESNSPETVSKDSVNNFAGISSAEIPGGATRYFMVVFDIENETLGVSAETFKAVNFTFTMSVVA